MPIAISDNVIQWLANGERGTSSNTILQTLTGIPAVGRWGGSHPHDPADLRRCILLLEAAPELRSDFWKMIDVSKQWKALVRHWDELCAMFEAETNWRTNRNWRAEKTYNRMQELFEECK